jgi:hypothetical protein
LHQFFTRSSYLAWEDQPIDLKGGGIVLAAHGTRYSDTALEGDPDGQAPLSPRSAMMCILSLSAVGWVVVLLPLLAAFH